MSEQAAEGVRVRIIGFHDHFMFDTDYRGLKYEVIRPDGGVVEKMVLWCRDDKTPVELDLSASADYLARKNGADSH